MKNNGRNGHNGKHGNGTVWMPEGIEVGDNPFISTRTNLTASESATLGTPAEPEAGQTAEEPSTPVKEHHRRKRRAMLLVVTMLALVCVGLGLYALYGGKKQVDYRITEKQKRKAGQPGQAAQISTGIESEATDQTTAEAINQAKEELRKAGVTPPASPAPSAAPAASQTGQPGQQAQTAHTPIFTPYIVPSEPVTEPPKKTGGSTTTGGAGQGGAPSGSGNPAEQGRSFQQPARAGSLATARSIYVGEPERAGKTASDLQTPTPSRTPNYELRHVMSTIPTVTLPGFGSMLPVRTLGAVYTLRNGSLVRLETTRDVSGEGWTIKRGTLLVAQSQGGEYDRAFLNLLGFIDPATGKFVRVSGDVLGSDGAPGLKGKRRRVDSRWSHVFNRTASGALLLGQAALARGSTTIVVPGSLNGLGSDFGLSATTLARKEFVEVPASTQAYVLITNLPKEARGTDAEPQDESDALSDQDLADLLTNGTPEQIREALPRMTPEMRKLARLALGEKLQ